MSHVFISHASADDNFVRDLRTRLEGLGLTVCQTGIVYKRTGDYAAAERAYRQSLAIETRRGNRAGQADTLLELGNLYNIMGRLDEAATFFRQAADLYMALEDLANEGRARNNLGQTLLQAIEEGAEAALAEQWGQTVNDDSADWFKAMGPKLRVFKPSQIGERGWRRHLLFRSHPARLRVLAYPGTFPAGPSRSPGFVMGRFRLPGDQCAKWTVHRR